MAAKRSDIIVKEVTKQPIKLHELATDYIDNRLPVVFSPHLDNAANTMEFNTVTNFYSARPPVRLSIEKVKSFTTEILFENAIELWRNRTQDGCSKKLLKIVKDRKFDADRFNIRRCTCWSDVMDIVRDAREVYMDEKGTQAIYRKYWRRFNENNPGALDGLKAWTQVIPNSDKMAIFSAGLIMIVDGAIRMVKIKESIQKSTEDIIDQVNATKTATDLFSDYPEVRKGAIELLIAILDALDNIVIFYLSKSSKRLIRAIAGQDSYEAVLEASLENISDRGARMFRYMELASFDRANQLQLQLSEMKNENSADNQEIKDMLNNSLSMFREIIKMSVWNQEMMSRSMMEQMERNFAQQRISQDAAILKLKQKSPKKRQAARVSIVEAIIERCPQAYQEALITYITRQGHYDVAQTDIEDSLHAIAALPNSEQARLGWLTRSELLRAWISSPQSAPLLVHANSIMTGKISVTSVMTAILARALQKEESRVALVLTFFCGMHSNLNKSEDALSGPLAMLKSLLDQLLRHPYSQFQFDLSLLKEVIVKGAIKGKIGKLARIFRDLVAQLPSEIVLFIIIDGVCYYEDEGVVDDLAVVVNELIGIASNPMKKGCSCTVKILLTSPTRTSGVVESFEESNVLDAPRHVEKGSVSGVAGKATLRREKTEEDVVEDLDSDAGGYSDI